MLLRHVACCGAHVDLQRHPSHPCIAPLRLVLGKYATEKVRRKLTTTARELEAAAGLAGTLEFGPELSEGSASESGSSGRVLRAEGSAHG